MSVHRIRSNSASIDYPVTERQFAASPNPTGIRFNDLIPESLRERFGKPLRSQEFFSNLYLHFNVWLIAVVGLLQQRRPFSFESTLFLKFSQ